MLDLQFFPFSNRQIAGKSERESEAHNEEDRDISYLGTARNTILVHFERTEPHSSAGRPYLNRRSQTGLCPRSRQTPSQDPESSTHRRRRRARIRRHRRPPHRDLSESHNYGDRSLAGPSRN